MLWGLCWLLAALLYGAEGRIDANFQKCSKFFFKEKMPSGFEHIASKHAFGDIPDAITNRNDLQSPAYICQTLGGTSYYATLYDRGRRIPLYSAYILDRRDKDTAPQCARTTQFKAEPQLIYRPLTENMLPITDTKKAIKQYYVKFNQDHKGGIQISEQLTKNQQSIVVEKSQAVDKDYTNSGYERGHINPCGHHVQSSNYLSTFTMTNIVPMLRELNTNVWSKHENDMVNIATVRKCEKMYVVTGVVPGNNKINQRVNIPSYVWNAYCCVDKNGQPIHSGGALVPNNKARANNILKVDNMSLSDLQEKLERLLGVSKISLFKCACEGETHCPTM